MNRLENTPEAKARFFVLYWGQEISCVAICDAPDKKGFAVDLCDWKVKHEDSYLELTPLSQISDEDLVALYNIYTDVVGYDGAADFKDALTIAKRWRFMEGEMWESNIREHTKSTFYSISRGYYVGDGTEIEYGWAVLKGGEQS